MIIQNGFNLFPNKPWCSRVCSTSLLKTLWEKEKLLVTSNFSFSHNVFFPFGELSVIFIKFEFVVRKFFHFGKVSKLSFGKDLIDRYRCNDQLSITDHLFPKARELHTKPITRLQNFRLVQIETNCRRHFKMHVN